MFTGPFDASILKRAREKKLLEIFLVDLRTFGIGTHKMVDDKPYGGGAGMVLRVDVIDSALQQTRCKIPCNEKVILLDAGGEPFSQEKARELSTCDHLILLCGHYEGVDERVRILIDEEVSIGNYVLTGGELPAMVMVDTIARLLPDVLGNESSLVHESFQNTKKNGLLLEHPHYTRPQTYKNMAVPQTLLSGNHKEIEDWRRNQAKLRTKKNRANLLKRRSRRGA